LLLTLARFLSPQRFEVGVIIILQRSSLSAAHKSNYRRPRRSGGDLWPPWGWIRLLLSCCTPAAGLVVVTCNIMVAPGSKFIWSYALCIILLMRRVHSEFEILCKVSVIEEDLYEQPRKAHKKAFVCDTVIPKDRTVPSVALFDPPLNPGFLKRNKKSLLNNELYVTFPSSWLSIDVPTATIVIPRGEKLTVVDAFTDRRLQQRHPGLRKGSSPDTTIGRELRVTKPQESVLVVRVSTNDAGFPISTSEAEREVFGIGAAPGEVSAASQFSACSFGEMELVSYAEGTVNGTIDVQLPNNTISYSKYTVRTEARDEVCTQLGYSEEYCPIPVDHIIYIVPFGLSTDIGTSGFAYGAVGGIYSVYQGSAFEPSTILHEFGHNSLLGHAGEPGEGEYGDDTGQMGSSYWSGTGNKRCFNGWNMRMMDWFKDRR